MSIEVESAATILRLVGITKYFGDLAANDHIDLDVREGEIHAILGENGAGKSTLMSVLYGVYPPDGGTITVRGKKRRFRSPLDAIDAGLGMVFQDFRLFPSLSVYENVVYRQEPLQWGLVVNRKESKRRVANLADKYGLKVDPDAPVETLSIGERQRVELLKVLYRDADLLILDEPTAVLTPQEVDALIGVLHRLKADGKTVIFITHKMREVMDLTDRATVLRRGRVVATVETAETSPHALSVHMTGRQIGVTERPAEREPGNTVLEVDDLRVTDDSGRERVKGVSLSVSEGEVVGIAGVAGNGQEEVVKALVGLAKSSGSIRVAGNDFADLSVADRRASFVRYIPEDRRSVGTCSLASVEENLLLGYQRDPKYQRRGWLMRDAVQAHSKRLMAEYDIKAMNSEATAGGLSGGNLQKVVVARELDRHLPLLIAEQPTRGLDLGAIEFVHSQMVAFRDAGGAVLLISAELGELTALSSRLLIMYEGQIVAEVDPRVVTEAEIGLHMTGAGEHV